MVYKKFQGETVLSGLNETSLKNLAKIGEWSYWEDDNLENILQKISRQTFQKSWDMSDDMTVQFFIAISLLFFLVFLLLSSSCLKKWNVL
jgi:hypothetical protein